MPRVMAEPTSHPKPKEDGVFAILFDVFFSLIFLSVIGVLFVAFCVLLGKYELLILAYVLLTAAVVRPMISEQRMEKLQKMAVIGEGLKIFTHLERYYLQYPPRSIFFYLFFPITGIFSFFFSKERGRRELKAHFILVQWILVLLLIQGFASYSRFYQHFPWRFASAWLYMELLSVYFLCNFFAIPAATTPIRLSVTGRRIRLMLVSFFAIVIMTGFLWAYKSGVRYDNLIPINIAMDRRMDALKQRVQLNYLRAKQGLPPLHPRKRKGQPQTEEFFTHFQDISEMYVRHLAPRILAFHKQHFFNPTRKAHEDFIDGLNKEFQSTLQRISSFGEHEQIFLTFTQEPGDIWGMILMPFRENLFYAFKIVRSTAPTFPPSTLPKEQAVVHFYRRWEDMPVIERNGFLQRWERGRYRFAAEKRMARVIVDTMRDLSRRTAPAEPEPAEEEPATQKDQDSPREEAKQAKEEPVITKKDQERQTAPARSQKDERAKPTNENIAPPARIGAKKNETPIRQNAEDADVPPLTTPKSITLSPPPPATATGTPTTTDPAAGSPPRDAISPRPKHLRHFPKRPTAEPGRGRRFAVRDSRRPRRAKPRPSAEKFFPQPRRFSKYTIPPKPTVAPGSTEPPAPSSSAVMPSAPSQTAPPRKSPITAKKQAPVSSPQPAVSLQQKASQAPDSNRRSRRYIRRWPRSLDVYPLDAVGFSLPSVPSLPQHTKEQNELQSLVSQMQSSCEGVFSAQSQLVISLGGSAMIPAPPKEVPSLSSFLLAYWPEAWAKPLGLSNLLNDLPRFPAGLPKPFKRAKTYREMLADNCVSLRLRETVQQSMPNEVSDYTELSDAERQRYNAKIQQALQTFRWLAVFLKEQQRFLNNTRSRFLLQQEEIQRKRRFFQLYNKTLRQLHLERALSAKLLFDHFGDTPPLPPLWWADLYEYFLRLLLFLFQLTMPIHILLILYCHIRLREPEDQATRTP